MKELLDRQVGTGADVVGHVAGAVKRAAQELDRDVPQLAGLVRTAADQIDGYADGLRGNPSSSWCGPHPISPDASRQLSSGWQP